MIHFLAHISELEMQLSALEEELEGMQENVTSEVTRTSRQVRAEGERELELKQFKINALSRENDKLQTEARDYSFTRKNSTILSRL